MARGRSWAVPVFVQTAPFWRNFSEQNTIRHGITQANRPVIAGTDQHIYGTDELSFDRPPHFNRMDAGELGLSNALNYTATPLRIMSEWGAGRDNIGARVPYGLHRMLDQLLRYGIDYACVWPLAYRYSSGGGGPAQLAGWNYEGRLYLSPGGVWYKTAMDAIIGRARIPPPANITGGYAMAFAAPNNSLSLLIAAAGRGLTYTLPPRYQGAVMTVIGWTQNPLISGTETAINGSALGTATVTRGATRVVLSAYQTAVLVK